MTPAQSLKSAQKTVRPAPRQRAPRLQRRTAPLKFAALGGAESIETASLHPDVVATRTNFTRQNLILVYPVEAAHVKAHASTGVRPFRHR